MVAQHIRAGALEDLFHGRFGHHSSALGDLTHAGEQFIHFLGLMGAQEIPYFSLCGYHVGQIAAVGDHIMHAHIAGHVFAQVVDAHVHQFHCVQRGASQMRRAPGVGRAPVKAEFDIRQAHHAALGG